MPVYKVGIRTSSPKFKHRAVSFKNFLLFSHEQCNKNPNVCQTYVVYSDDMCRKLSTGAYN